MKNEIIELDKKDIMNMVEEAAKQVLHEREILNEMARVGYIDGQLEVYVKTNDGRNVPHVHIRDANTQGRLFETCVELARNKYFLHGNKNDILNKKQCKDFNKFMHDEIHTRTYNGTMYEFAVDMWNSNNSNVNIEVQYDTEDKPIIPDYTNIELNK